MRTVFLGTSEFAAAVLQGLADRHRPLLVVTRPDRPAGRGRRLSSPPVAQAARALGLELVQPAGVNDEATRELIAAVRPHAVIVCAFGALIKEPLLSEHELLNVHPSLLPRWRGAAPLERAIMAGDAHTGVSIMRLTAGLDSGPVCLSHSEPIAPDDTYGSLAPRLERIGAKLLTRALDAIEQGQSLPFSEQDEAGATYAEKITAVDRLLDPDRTAVELERVVRALHPHIGARLRLSDGSVLRVLHARVAQAPQVERASQVERESQVGQASQPHGPEAGSTAAQLSAAPGVGAIRGYDGRLLYGTVAGALELLRVQPAGGRPMDAASYLRGHAC